MLWLGRLRFRLLGVVGIGSTVVCVVVESLLGGRFVAAVGVESSAMGERLLDSVN